MPIAALFLLIPALGAAGQLPTLTSARTVHDLPYREALRRYPVELRAVVTYYDPYIDERHGALFICDESGGIFVSLPARPVLPLRPGTAIALRGVSGPGDYASIVEQPEIRILDQSRLPRKAARANRSDLLTGAYDGQWVEVEGVVHSVREQGMNVYLDLALGDGMVSATTVKENGADYARLVDTEIRMRACAAPTFTRHRQMTGARLFFPTLNEITVIKAAGADPFAQPPQLINSLMRFTPGVMRFHRIHVRGRVTLDWPGRKLCIRDESQGLCVQTTQMMRVDIGRQVDVVGFPSEGDYTPTLTDAQFVAAGTGSAGDAVDVTAEQVFQGEHDFELIRIEGQLLTQDRSSRDPMLVISSGEHLFAAVLPRASAAAETAWQNGSRLRVTGICSIKSDPRETALHEGTTHVGSFQVLLRSPRDIEVRHTPSWWTPAHAVTVLGIVLAATIAVLIWVAVLRDRVRSQTEVIWRQLKEAEALKAAAESASHAKSAFVASMSHEIRTPLTGILGFADLMAMGELNSEQREFNQVVRSSAQSLLVIINDILDFSRIEAGRMELESVEFAVRQCVEDALRPIQPLAAAKGLAVMVDVESGVPEWLRGDPHRLRQILLNLAGNAIKFTDTGRIMVRVSTASAPDPTLAALQFAVSDTGVGIPEQQRSAIFEPFRQADGSITRRFGGTGLGLSISSKLVALMNGRIWLESREDQGSTFYFTICLPRCSAPQETECAISPGPDAHRESLSILVAEDNAINQRLVGRLLQSRGHRAAVVGNGLAALQACRDSSYDLILMDVQMPDMDGLEATRRIRAQEQSAGRHTPIVAMTANAMQGDREQCIAAGMDGYISKPIVIGELDRVLALYGAAGALAANNPIPG